MIFDDAHWEMTQTFVLPQFTCNASSAVREYDAISLEVDFKGTLPLVMLSSASCRLAPALHTHGYERGINILKGM